MKFDTNTTQLTLIQKKSQLFIKIAVCLLLLGFTYRFYFATPVIVVRDDDRKSRSSMQPVTADETLPDYFPGNNTGIYEGILCY